MRTVARNLNIGSMPAIIRSNSLKNILQKFLLHNDQSLHANEVFPDHLKIF